MRQPVANTPGPRHTLALWQRVRSGDDEALQVLVAEWQEAAMGYLPSSALQQIPGHTLLALVALATLEAAVLWQPEREAFGDCVRRRVVARVVHFQLASFPLAEALVLQ